MLLSSSFDLLLFTTFCDQRSCRNARHLAHACAIAMLRRKPPVESPRISALKIVGTGPARRNRAKEPDSTGRLESAAWLVPDGLMAYCGVRGGSSNGKLSAAG